MPQQMTSFFAINSKMLILSGKWFQLSMVIKLYAGGCCSKLWFVYSIEQQSIACNAFDKVSSITDGNQLLQITYGHHRQRIGQQYTATGSTTYKVYVGACEYITKNGQTTTHTYLSGPEGLFALHVKNPNGTENIRYIHKDHLGSWNTITDENGNMLQELSFNACSVKLGFCERSEIKAFLFLI